MKTIDMQQCLTKCLYNRFDAAHEDMPELDEYDSLEACSNVCTVSVNPPAWYHMLGSDDDLCVNCFNMLAAHNQSSYVNILSIQTLSSDLKLYSHASSDEGST